MTILPPPPARHDAEPLRGRRALVAALPLALAPRLAGAREVSPVLALDPIERGWIARNPVVTYTVPFETRPLLWQDQGRPRGLVVDVLDRASALTGLEFRYTRSADREEAFSRLRSAELDLVAMVRADPDRRSGFVYTQPFVSSPLGLYVRADADASVGMASLIGRRVAVPMGLASVLPDDGAGPVWVPVAASGSAIRGLAEGRWEGAVVPELAASHVLALIGPGRVRWAATLPQVVPFAMAVNASGARLASILDAVLRRTLAPEREDMLARWTRPDREEGLPTAGLVVGAVAVAAIAAAAGLGLRVRRARRGAGAGARIGA